MRTKLTSPKTTIIHLPIFSRQNFHQHISSFGWLVLSGLLMFAPMLEGGTTHTAVMIIRLLVLLGVLVGIGAVILEKEIVFPSVRIGVPVLVFMTLAAISTIRSPYTHQSVQWFIVLLSYAILLYLLVFFVTRWDHVWKLLAVVCGIALFESTLTLVQAWWVGVARPRGTFFNPNFLGGYLAAVFVVILGGLSYSRIRWCAWWRARSEVDTPSLFSVRRGLGAIAGVGTLTLILLAIISTGSRGAALSLLIGASIVIGLRFGVRGVTLLVVVICLGLFIPNPLRDRVQQEHQVNPLAYSRWPIWEQSVRASVEHPFGVGLGLYQYVSPRYAVATEGQLARYGKVARTSHNEYLQMALELGMVAPLILIWGVILAAREAALILKQRLARRQRAVVVGLIGGAAVILSHAAFDSNLHNPALAILLTVFVGIIFSVKQFTHGKKSRGLARRIPIPSPWLWAGVGALCCAVLGIMVVRMGLAWMSYEAGSLAQTRQDFPAALSHFQTAVAHDPRKALYHSALASTHFRTFQNTRDGRAGEATVEELHKAIALNPLDGRLYGILGRVYMARSSGWPHSLENQPQRTALSYSALSAYHRAAELEPYSPFHLLELGKLYLERGKLTKAEDLVKKAVTVEPNFLPGRAWLAHVYLDSDQPERRKKAEVEYREILNRNQRYSAWSKTPYENRLLTVDTSRMRERFK